MSIERIAPKQTPRPVIRAEDDPVTMQLANMSDAGWACVQYLEDAAGNVIYPETPVTPTISATSSTGITVDHFYINMPVAMANLLVTVGDQETQYRWYNKITNTSSPLGVTQEPVSKQLLVSRAHGDITGAATGSGAGFFGNDGITHDYVPAPTKLTAGGVKQLTIPVQKRASGVDSQGRPIAVDQQEQFSENEVNRIMEVVNDHAVRIDQSLSRDDESLVGKGPREARILSTDKFRWYQDDGSIYDKAVGSNVWIKE